MKEDIKYILLILLLAIVFVPVADMLILFHHSRVSGEEIFMEEIVTDVFIESGNIKIKDNATLKDIIWLLNEVGIFCYDEEVLQNLKNRGCFEIEGSGRIPKLDP